MKRGRMASNGQESISNNLAGAFTRSAEIDHQKREFYRKYGHYEPFGSAEPITMDDKLKTGAVTLLTQQQYIDSFGMVANKNLPGKYTEVLIGDRVIPVDNQLGLRMLDEDYFRKIAEERRSEAEYLQELTEFLVFSTDDMLFQYSPQMYFKAKSLNILPSQIEFIVPNTPAMSKALWEFRNLVVNPNKHLSMMSSGKIPNMTRDKDSNQFQCKVC